MHRVGRVIAAVATASVPLVLARKEQVKSHPTVVVGGGILGRSTALALHLKGCRAIVCDEGNGASMPGQRIVSLTRNNGLPDKLELDTSQELLRQQQAGSDREFYKETGVVLIRKDASLSKQFPERIVNVSHAEARQLGVNMKAFTGQEVMVDTKGGILDLEPYMDYLAESLPPGTIKSSTVVESVEPTGLLENLRTGASYRVRIRGQQSPVYATNVVECMGVGGIQRASELGIKMTVNVQGPTYVPVNTIEGESPHTMPVSGTTDSGVHTYFFPPKDGSVRIGTFEEGPGHAGIIVADSLEHAFDKMNESDEKQEKSFLESSQERAVATLAEACTGVAPANSEDDEAFSYPCPVTMPRKSDGGIYRGPVIVARRSFASRFGLGGVRVGQFGCVGNGAKYGPGNGEGLANLVVNGEESPYIDFYSEARYQESYC